MFEASLLLSSYGAQFRALRHTIECQCVVERKGTTINSAVMSIMKRREAGESARRIADVVISLGPSSPQANEHGRLYLDHPQPSRGVLENMASSIIDYARHHYTRKPDLTNHSSLLPDYQSSRDLVGQDDAAAAVALAQARPAPGLPGECRPQPLLQCATRRRGRAHH